MESPSPTGVTARTPLTPGSFATTSSAYACAAGAPARTTTVTGAAETCGKRWSTVSATCRPAEEAGSTAAPELRISACANGAPAATSSAVQASATGTARRRTRRTVRLKKPSSGTGADGALIRWPAKPSRAGISVSAAATAITTTLTPAAATAPSTGLVKMKRPDSATATVSPEKATVRPAVAEVRSTAAAIPAPWPRSSRNRLTISSA